MTLEYAVIILAVTAVLGSYIQYRLGYRNGFESGYEQGITTKLRDMKIIKFYKNKEDEQ